MPSPPPGAPRALDPIAVDAALRRLARRETGPWLHGEVARRMAERLSIVRLRPHTVIDWWSFLGQGHALLAEAYPDAQHLIVEPTPLLQRRSAEALRAPWWSTRRWRGAAPRVVAPADLVPGGAQLVWANMMLHGVMDPPALMERWKAALEVDGFVMFSCLGPGTLRELRSLYARLGWAAPSADFVDMHDLGDMLVQAGFADPVMDQETLTLQWADAASLLAELRTLGGNCAPSRFEGLRTPRWRARLERELAVMSGADGRFTLDFEVAYGHAFKAAPRVRMSESSIVSLDEMRSMVRSSRSRDG